MSQFRISGRIINCQTHHGVPGLRVEAWDKDSIFDDLVGSALTDANGSFQMGFDESYFNEYFSDRRPDLFFRIFYQNRLILSTEDSVLWNVDRSDTEIVIEVDTPVEPEPQPQPFIVQGHIRLADESPVIGTTVRAFDKDLRCEQLLGQKQTDNQGFYRITYFAQQFRKREKDSADLIVKAFTANNSLLATSPVLFNAPPVAEIDLTIPADIQQPLTLFEKIERALEPLRENLPVEQLQEDEHDQDVSFLAGETGIEKNDIARFVMAHKLAQQAIQPEFWFVLLGGSFYQFTEDQNLEQQLAAILDSLPSLDAAAVHKAFTRGFNQQEIPEAFRENVDSWVEAFLQFIASRRVSESERPTFVKSALVDAGILSAEKQVKFARLFNQHKAFTPELLEVLEQDESFTQPEIDDLHTSFRLTDLTQSDFSIVKAIKDEFNVRQPAQIRTLAKRSESEWVNLVTTKHVAGEIDLPFEVSPIAEQEKLPEAEVYGKMLNRQFREAFPTTAFTGGLERALQNGGSKGFND